MLRRKDATRREIESEISDLRQRREQVETEMKNLSAKLEPLASEAVRLFIEERRALTELLRSLSG
jgi:hypothetical protein